MPKSGHHFSDTHEALQRLEPCGGSTEPAKALKEIAHDP